MDISKLDKEILALRKELQIKEELLLSLKEKACKNEETNNSGIPRWAIERYSRQALLAELGSSKETISKLMKSSVLIIGAGGLGSPASIYLAGAGIGHIGIVDYDEVELTNLHRQPLHSETSIGMSKVESAALTLRRMNSNIKINTYKEQLNSSNALRIISQYDVIVDATDNAVTRYLINDACVISGKPLVSAAALQLSGQLTVYNHPSKNASSDVENGLCYRCLFPTPAPAELIGSCSQNGVLGPVPGTMGCLQAIETIKIILGKQSLAGYLLLFDADDCTFTKVKLRKRNPNCAVCSDNPIITELIDYEQFCNAQASDKDLNLKILSPDERISPQEFHKHSFQKLTKCDSFDDINLFNQSVLIDVRSAGEFDMCNIEKSLNCPIDKLIPEDLVKMANEKKLQEVYFVCRRGNDSQIAAKKFKDKWVEILGNANIPLIKDIEGGLHGWAKFVDNDFPIY